MLLRVAGFIALIAGPLEAQEWLEKEPPRPSLKANADTNDWREYYNYAMSLVATRPGRAADMLYWAERLDPTRAEPTYARWAVLWITQPRMLKEYYEGSERVINSPAVRRLDSLNYLARLRNPLVNQGIRRLVLKAMFDHAEGERNWEWSMAPENVAWLNYTEGNYKRAAERFGGIIARNPDRNYHLRFDRALAFYAMSQFDSAATELTKLVEELHRRDRKHLVYFYDSKAMFEYSVGLLHTAAGRYEDARQAFMRALSEDLAFYPAHSALGTVSLALGDTAAAINEYRQALELNGRDPVIRYDFSLVLMNAGQHQAAIDHLDYVIRTEPWFASPYYYLGRILDAQGRHPEAMTYYHRFLERAPRTLVQALTFVRGRMTEFSAAGIIAAPMPTSAP
jgi:tetratricopeptide (TPR) repeat protein